VSSIALWYFTILRCSIDIQLPTFENDTEEIHMLNLNLLNGYFASRLIPEESHMLVMMGIFIDIVP
jgi:hypothetical protein